MDNLLGGNILKLKMSLYEESIRNSIYLIYFLGFIVWFLIIASLQLYQNNDVMAWLILCLPIIMFLLALESLPYLDTASDDLLFKSTCSSFALLVVTPLLTMLKVAPDIDQTAYIRTLIVAIILTLLSIMDLWVRPKTYSVMKHGKSILQVMALTLIIYALYSTYVEYYSKQ